MCTHCMVRLDRHTDPAFEVLRTKVSDRCWVVGQIPLTSVRSVLEADLLLRRLGKGSLSPWNGFALVIFESHGREWMPVRGGLDVVFARARQESLQRWVPVEIIQGVRMLDGAGLSGRSIWRVTPVHADTWAMDTADRIDQLLSLMETVPVHKADGITPNTKAGFEREVRRLTLQLHEAVDAVEAPALRQAIGSLRAKWAELSEDQRNSRLNSVARTMTKALAGLASTIAALVKTTMPGLVSRTRAATLEDLGSALAVSTHQLDPVVIESLRSQAGLFVTSRSGQWNALTDRLRPIVADGLDRGLSSNAIRDQIAGLLADELNRSRDYAAVVAQAWIQDARSFGQLSGYEAAGISIYRIEAVLDEHTTEECRFLDGKRFSVEDGLNKFAARQGKDPQAIKEISPWIRNSGGQLWVPGSDGKKIVLANVVRSGVGTRDDVGEFEQLVDDIDLDAQGIGFPPYHGHCRTTTVAEL